MYDREGNASLVFNNSSTIRACEVTDASHIVDREAFTCMSPGFRHRNYPTNHFTSIFIKKLQPLCLYGRGTASRLTPCFNASSGTGRIPDNEDEIASDMYVALQDFFGGHPELCSRPFFMTGESYAGKYIPALGKHLFILLINKVY